MTKNDNKQSCSSDNGEVCHKVKCEPRCEKPCCDFKKCPCLDPRELHCLYKDAVVEIHSEFILLGATGSEVAPIEGATGGTPLGAGTRADVILDGNGFFIKGHYIVAPAHLVLLPPSLTSVVNRFPFFDPDNLDLGQIRDQSLAASRILVSVFNVNGKGHSFVYEADLVGVDGAGDIAVLRINYRKQWNFCNPCVEKCHPVFKFGKSRAAKEGEKVYLIGDYISDAHDRRLFNAAGAIADGLLSDHRYLDYSGWILPELVLVSAPAYAFSSGLPILNCQGEVIGMQTTDLAAVLPAINLPEIDLFVGGVADLDVLVDPDTGVGSATGPFSATGTIGPLSLNQSEGLGLVAGPSEFFLRRVVKTLIKGTCNRKFNCHLETVCDPVGPYYRYKKAYAGIAYDVFTGPMYDITTDFTSGSDVALLPRIRLGPNGEFLNFPSCKQLLGLRVLGLAGLNPADQLAIANGAIYVPGGTGVAPMPEFLPVSPFLNKLLPGDQITHINGLEIGDLNKQIAPSLITWRLCAGDQLEITYRRGGNAPNGADNAFTENYENLFNHAACLADFPALMDYPWYAINQFPLLRDRGFDFGAQLDNPQLPQFTNGAPFHPAF